MLVLSRKVSEKIHIGDNVVITVVDIGAGRVKIGIDAPRDVRVVRTEILDAAESPAEKSVGLVVRQQAGR